MDATSQECAACGKARGFLEFFCKQCFEPLCAADQCELVWMPKEDMLFCSRSCLKQFSNSFPEHDMPICKRPVGSSSPAGLRRHSPRLAEQGLLRGEGGVRRLPSFGTVASETTTQPAGTQAAVHPRDTPRSTTMPPPRSKVGWKYEPQLLMADGANTVVQMASSNQ